MKRGLVASLILHAAILAFMLLGPARPLHDLPEMLTPISVEMAPIEDVTRVVKNTAPPPQPVQKPVPPTPAPPKPIPAPAPPAISEPPPPAPAPALEPVPAPPAPVKAAAPDPDAVALKPAAPNPPKPAQKPAVPKPVAPPRPQTKPQDIAKKNIANQTNDSFSELLKDLKRKPPAPVTAASEVRLDAAPEDEPAAGEPADHLSMSELDAVRRQIQRCWNIPAGLRDAYDLVVDVEVNVAPDGTVQSARVVNDRPDPQFRAAAESARRAPLHPRCNPLQLPREKYAQWKQFTFRFNPRDLL